MIALSAERSNSPPQDDLFGPTAFAESAGGLIYPSGMTGGADSKIGKLIGLVTKRNPKDFPALKSEISKIQREAGKNPDGLAHLKIDGEHI